MTRNRRADKRRCVQSIKKKLLRQPNRHVRHRLGVRPDRAGTGRREESGATHLSMGQQRVPV